MPNFRKYPKKSKKTAKKKKQYKKPKTRASYTFIREPTQMADKTTVKLIYTDRIFLSGDDDLVEVYRGAGAYSPKVGGSLRPAGWNNYANYYSNYYCSSSKCTLQMISTGPGTNLQTCCQVVLIPYASPHPLSVVDTYKIADEAYARSQIVGGAGGSSINYLSNFISYKKMLGRSSKCNLQDDNNAHATTTYLPNDDWYWHIFASSVTDSSAITNLAIFVKIAYYVTFYGRKDVVGIGTDNELTGITGSNELDGQIPFGNTGSQ